VAPTVDLVRNHLAALQLSLIENKWMSPVDSSVLAVFSELLAAAQLLAPEGRVLQAIERPRAAVSAASLLMLVDQILVALAEPVKSDETARS
jgi:hypothetical protein